MPDKLAAPLLRQLLPPFALSFVWPLIGSALALSLAWLAGRFTRDARRARRLARIRQRETLTGVDWAVGKDWTATLVRTSDGRMVPVDQYVIEARRRAPMGQRP